MKLSLVMIAKDEEWCLGRCLDSVKGVVDEIVLVDTGSTDRTKEIAREHGALVLEQPWADDFSAPRNLAAEHAMGEWLLVLDADEVLPTTSGRLIRQVCEQVRDQFVSINLPLLNAASLDLDPDVVAAKHEGIPTPVERLVKAGTRWKHRIHEIPDVKGSSANLGAFIVHYGYAKDSPGMARKTNRNLEILKAELETNPTDVYVAGFLVGEYLARYERQFEAWARGGQNPDRELLVSAAKVVDAVLPHVKPNDLDSYRLVANWGIAGIDLGEATECIEAGGMGEIVLPGHPDWCYLRGVGHYFRMMQTRGQERQDARAKARLEIRKCLHKLNATQTAVVLIASKEKCNTALERINRPPNLKRIEQEIEARAS